MKKLSLTLVALVVLTTVAMSQSVKDVVCLGNFTYSSSIGDSYAEGFRNEILKGITATTRITMRDIQADMGRKGANQTDDASTVDENTLVKMKDLSSKYLIQGHLTTLGADKVTDKEGRVSYRGSLNYSIKLVDVATGATEAESYEHTGSSFLISTGMGDTPEKAVSNIMDNIKDDMKKFVNVYFPLEGTILEIAGEKKGAATDVYISLGSANGIQKGQAFDVFVAREIAGRASQKNIGEIKATAVEGGDLTLCKVSKGGKEIKEVVGEGQVTIVRTKLGGGGIFGSL
jgi:hypothetical protein